MILPLIFSGPSVVHIWKQICKRALHLPTQNNSGIPILKQQVYKEIQSYQLKSEEEHKLSLGLNSLDNLVMPEISTEIQADTPQSSLPTSTEEDNLVKELHIKYGNLQINMSPACIKLQNDLVLAIMITF